MAEARPSAHLDEVYRARPQDAKIVRNIP